MHHYNALQLGLSILLSSVCSLFPIFIELVSSYFVRFLMQQKFYSKEPMRLQFQLMNSPVYRVCFSNNLQRIEPFLQLSKVRNSIDSCGSNISSQVVGIEATYMASALEWFHKVTKMWNFWECYSSISNEKEKKWRAGSCKIKERFPSKLSIYILNRINYIAFKVSIQGRGLLL